MNRITTALAASPAQAFTAAALQEATHLSLSRVRVLIKEALSVTDIEIVDEDADVLEYRITSFGAEAVSAEEPAAPVQDEETEDADVPATLEEPAEDIAAPVKAKRVVLNPQPVIDKKTAVLDEAGFALTYASRMWTIRNNETGLCFSFNSQTLAAVKVAEIVEYANMQMPVEAPAVA